MAGVFEVSGSIIEGQALKDIADVLVGCIDLVVCIGVAEGDDD